MIRRGFLFATMIVISSVSLPVRGQQPVIPARIQKFWEQLSKARTVSFMVQVWDWEQYQEIAPRPYKRLRQTFEVKIQKPNRVALQGAPPQIIEIPPGKNEGMSFRTTGSYDNIQISDGKRSLVLNTVFRTYRYVSPLKTLDEPQYGPVTGLKFDFLFDTTPMKDFLPLPVDRPRDDFGYTYFLPPANPKLPGEARFVFNPYTGELSTFSIWWPTKEGVMEEAERLTFRHWDFNAPLPRSTFDTRLPRGYKTMEQGLKEQEALSKQTFEKKPLK